MSEPSNWTNAVSQQARQQVFEKTHREVINAMQAGNADAAYTLVRLLCLLAHTSTD